MSNSLPKYDSPPVVETVLSAQFVPLNNFTNAHAGWFWKNYLDKDWISVKAASRIDDQFERFGEEIIWRQPGIMVHTEPSSERLQILQENEERMIQVQNSRFIYNWRKREGDYPSYDKLLPEFLENFEKFKQFAVDSGNSDDGDLSLNQWEVTYVNQIPKGELWNSPGDWNKILKNYYVPALGVEGQTFDSFNGEFHLIIGENIGRLHIQIKKVYMPTNKIEIFILQLTARGPVDLQRDLTLERGFDVGHEAIVNSFTDMTEKNVHSHWGRTQ